MTAAPAEAPAVPDELLRVNKAAARRVLEEIFPANDQHALREVMDENFVNHEAPPGTPPGLGSVTMFMGMLSTAFSDQQWTMQQVIAEGDLVAIHCIHSGRHTGTFFGLPATGRSFSYKQMHVIKMRDGKGVEHWAVRDDAGLMRQLTETSTPA
ncbi:MAG TPA: ester cyclase [Propionibacteriaceae bacterium]|nr:ester cyclase [Propionibacteriaceae bacterium]